jgi:carnitine-CoA ligase
LFDVRIFDDEDAEVPEGQPGEIVCRPRARHVMFEGYHRNPAATVAQWRNGWFHTGDFGRIDTSGNLFFVDRKKDAMRRRGENISSFEVEQSVQRHPAVAEVAAHAVPSAVGEDDVKICVVLRAPEDVVLRAPEDVVLRAPEDDVLRAPGDRVLSDQVTAEELLQHCIERMPSFAVPRYIELVDDLPRNAVGRVLKYVLRERGVTPETWDREHSALALRPRENRKDR